MTTNRKPNVGGLWKARDNDKGLVYRGTINGQRVVIFTNEFKKEENHPDYIVREAYTQPDTTATTTHHQTKTKPFS